MKPAVLSMCSKETSNNKISTLPQRTVNHILFIPPSFRSTSYQCLVGIANAKAFNVGISKKTFFWGNRSPCYTTHLCQPILNQSPKDTPLNFTSLGLRLSSRTSLFWTLPEQLSILHHACVPTHPEPTFQKYTTKLQTLRFSSHTSALNFAGAALHVTPRMWANPSWTNVPRHTAHFRSESFHVTHPCFELCRNRLHLACVPTLNQRSKDTPQNLRPWDFHLTHPCFELCRSNPEQITPRMCANPSWTNVPKIHHKLQTLRFSSHTSLFWTLPEQLAMLHHACEPTILYQRHKIHHKRLMTQFCKPILIQPPKIHLSKFQCSRYRRQKCRALQEDTVEWKPVCAFRPKMVLSKLQWLKLPAPNLLQKCSRGVPSAEILWLHGSLKIKILKYVKRTKR